MRRFGHHSAVAHSLVVALIEDAIYAHGTHIHIADLGPAKELVVEVESAFEVGCVELVPADRAGGRWCWALWRWHVRVGREDHDCGALRIGHDGEAKHAG